MAGRPSLQRAVEVPILPLSRLAPHVGAVLKRYLGRPVRLGAPQLVADRGRNVVSRWPVDEPAAGRGCPSSVLVKQLKADTSLGFTDWASLAFLSGLAQPAGPDRADQPANKSGAPSASSPTSVSTVADVAPRCYGGDAGKRFFLMEDLGGERSLDDLLGGGDPEALHAALGRLSRLYGRLHASTVGHEAAFLAALSHVPADGYHGRDAEAQQWLATLERVEQWVARAGCSLAGGFHRTCERIASVYATPGPWLAFTHGDPAPTNNHVRDAPSAAVRLLDFEYGAFRHALYDLTAWYILCPLPDALVQDMSRCYRRELLRGCAVARDLSTYRRAWATMAAYRALAMLTWISPDVLDQDRPWVGEWSARSAVLTAVSRLVEVAGPVLELHPIAATAGALREALRARWPEHDGRLPTWPVLQAPHQPPLQAPERL